MGLLQACATPSPAPPQEEPLAAEPVAQPALPPAPAKPKAAPAPKPPAVALEAAKLPPFEGERREIKEPDYRDGSHGSTLQDPVICDIAAAHAKTPPR